MFAIQLYIATTNAIKVGIASNLQSQKIAQSIEYSINNYCWYSNNFRYDNICGKYGQEKSHIIQMDFQYVANCSETWNWKKVQIFMFSNHFHTFREACQYVSTTTKCP